MYMYNIILKYSRNFLLIENFHVMYKSVVYVELQYICLLFIDVDRFCFNISQVVNNINNVPFISLQSLFYLL